MRPLGNLIDANLIGHGKAFEPGDEKGDACGNVDDEGAEIADNGWKGYGEEKDEREDNGAEKKEDSEAPGHGAPANLELHDPGDDGEEDNGEERADVEDLEFFEEMPGEKEADEQAEEEGDVTAGDVAAALGVFDEERVIRC